MSNDDRFIGQLEDYLEAFDGITPLPDRVRNAIRAELPSARQVRPRPGPERVLTMLSNASAGVRLGLAAAAIVAAVVLGAAFLNNNRSGDVGAPPTPAPTATTAPTTAPTPTPAPSVAAQPLTLSQAPAVACDATDPGKSCGAPGTYQLNNWPGPSTWPVMVTVDEPAGWFNWEAGPGWDALLVADAQGTGSGWGVMFYTVGDVAVDPCDSTKGWIPAAQVDTPVKLATAMAAWPRFTATSPQPITIDGHGGVEFQLTSTAKSSCADTASAGHSTSGASVDVYPTVNQNGMHDPSTVEIVDTGDGLLVIRATDFPQTSPAEVEGGQSPNPTAHADDLADLHAILDSIRLTVPSSSS
jgi:hypothetical protein